MLRAVQETYLIIRKGEEMRIEIKDLNRIENQDNIVNKLCELDTRTFNAVFRASLKIRKANKILERNGAL
jgi:hypothetical protein